MTVSELVQKLDSLPPDMDVTVYDRYDGENRDIYGVGMMWRGNDGNLWHQKDDAYDAAELHECVADGDERIVLPELKQVAVVELAGLGD